MAAARFNTLNFTRRLRAAGVPEAQAEAFADALSEDAIGELASKSDVEGARRDLNTKIDDVHREMKAELTGLRRDLVEQGKDLRAEMRDLENRLVIKLGAMMAAIAALLFAGLKLSH